MIEFLSLAAADMQTLLSCVLLFILQHLITGSKIVFRLNILAVH